MVAQSQVQAAEFIKFSVFFSEKKNSDQMLETNPAGAARETTISDNFMVL
jgi:hypothetical protein